MKFKIIIILFFFINTISYSQAIVNSVTFEGNNYFSNNELLNSVVLKRDKQFNKTQFDLDLKSIREKYRNAGFLLARIIKSETIFDKDSTIVDISIYIEESKKVNVGKIILTGNKIINEKEILNLFETKVGKPLDDNVLNNDIKSLLDYYEKKGIPFSKVKVKEITLYNEGNNSKINVEILITENDKTKIDIVKIKGNEITNDDIILRELKIGKDNLVQRESMQNMKRRLENLNIFERVDDFKIYTIKKSGKTGLLINVKEGNTNTFDGVIGYAPAVNNTQSGYLTGLVNLSFRNIFGTGRRIDAKWQKPVKATQELEFKYGEPYFFGLPMNMNLGFLQRIQDTTYTRRKFDLKSDFQFTDKFAASIIGSYDRVIPSDDTTRTFRISDSRIFSGGFEFRYDSRDYIYNPQGGILYKLFYSYGDKKILNSSSSLNLNEKSYSIQKYSMDLEIYLTPFKRFTNMLKFFGGDIRSDKLEDADYYRIGGNKNIRGYREEQFLASRLAYSNIEFRYSFSRKGFIFAFYDFGYYFRPADDLNHIFSQEGFLYGYGIGIRMETALGLVGVNYGLGKGDGLTDGKINFGLINEF